MSIKDNFVDNRDMSQIFLPVTPKYHMDSTTYAQFDFEQTCKDYILRSTLIIGNNKNKILKTTLYTLIFIIAISTSIFFIINFFSDNIAKYSLILISFTSIVILLRKAFSYLISPKVTLEKIKKIPCYQEIIKEIKKKKIDEVYYIYINKNKIVVCDNKDNKMKINFRDFDYPSLSMDKQPLVLAGIINDLFIKDAKKFVLTTNYKDIGLKSINCSSEEYIYEGKKYQFDNLFIAYNCKCIKEEDII